MSYYEAPTVVYMHTETTGFDSHCHIVQLAAKCGRREFNVYVRPNRQVAAQAAQRNGFYYDFYKEELTLWGRRVVAKPLEDAIIEFCNFLRSCGGDVIVTAHNNFAFQGKHLLKAAGWVGCRDYLDESCSGFSDTLPMVRGCLYHLNCHTLENLADKYLAYQPKMNHALDKVRVLSDVIYELDFSDEEIADWARDTNQVYSNHVYSNHVYSNHVYSNLVYY